MSIELKIDVNMGSTSDHQQGRVVVRGYFRNLGPQSQRLCADDVQYSLQGPNGKIEVRNEGPRHYWIMSEVQPFAKVEFESELIAYGPPELKPGSVYSLTATLPDGSDQDVSKFTFMQMYLAGPQIRAVSTAS